jgi:hypothetical protein
MALSSIFFIGKTSVVYGALTFSFSMLGLILPDAFLVGNIDHILTSFMK